jgi:hypothetical protein
LLIFIYLKPVIGQIKKRATFVSSMKKIIVSILAILYLGVSSGVAMQVHYCMGERAGVDLYGDTDDHCGKCGMKANKGGCCADENKFFKLEDSHKTVSNDVSLDAPEYILPTTTLALNWLFKENLLSEQINNHSPPTYSGPGSCILNCVFRL